MKSVDVSYRLLAAKYVRRQAKKLGTQFDAIFQAESIEPVHQARVASRRLRAALRMFGNCFKPRQVKRWRKAIRRVTSELGDARDTDVQIEFLIEALDRLTDKSFFPAVAQLLANSQSQRERLQAPTVTAVERLRASGVLREMEKAGRKITFKAARKQVPSESPAARSQAGKYLLKNVQRLLCYQESLARPTAIEQHHAMRIAAKRLRYTAEIAAPLYEGQLDETVEVLKRLQTLLGELHDCDVWLARLDVFAEKQRRKIRCRWGHEGPMERLTPGIEYLTEDRKYRRAQVFKELVAFWQQLEAAGQWERLDKIACGQSEPEQQEPPSGHDQS